MSIAVGGTIVADTLTLLVLAVVGGMFRDNVTGLYWVWLVVKVILLGVVIVFSFPGWHVGSSGGMTMVWCSIFSYWHWCF